MQTNALDFMSGLRFFFLLSFFLGMNIVWAEPGQLNPSFGERTAGYVQGSPVCFARQQDGKVLIGFGTSFPGPSVNGETVAAIARLTPDGRLDKTFQADPELFDSVYAIDYHADGTMVAVGAVDGAGLTKSVRVAKLQPDGSLDPTFSNLTGPGTAQTVLRLPDGKLLVGGDFSSYGGFQRKGLVRLQPNGAVDTSFDTGEGFNGTVSTLTRQGDGKILAGGDFTQFAGVTTNRIARLHETGAHDESFNTGAGFFSGRVYKIVALTDGSVLVRGDFTQFDGVLRVGLVRIFSDGTLDRAFIPPQINGFGTLAVQDDGRIVVSGSFDVDGRSNDQLIRLMSSGKPDGTFPAASAANVRQIEPADGSLFVLANGTANGKYRPGLAEITDTGAVTDFMRPTGPNRFVARALVKPNGRILLGGGFTYYDGIFSPGVVELNEDGTVATAYNPGFEFNGEGVVAMALEANGNVLLVNGSGALKRVFPNGSPDTAFRSAAGPVSSVAVDPNGKILIAGDLYVYEPVVKRFSVARLNVDGSLDNTFTPPPRQGQVTRVAALPDGKVLISGTGYPVGGGSQSRTFARLHSNGSEDTSFVCDMPTPSTGLFDWQVLPDGKILAATNTTVFDEPGFPQYAVVKLNQAGSVDPGFKSVFLPGGQVYALAVQTDGRLLIGGDFSMVNGVKRENIARLDPDGSFDSTFMPGEGIQGVESTEVTNVRSLALTQDGQVVVAGGFGLYNGEPRNHLVKLQASGTSTAPRIQLAGALSAEGDEDVPIIFNIPVEAPSGGKLTWQASDSAMGRVDFDLSQAPAVVTYTGNANRNGKDKLTLVVTDELGRADSILLEVTLRAVNDPPVMTAPPTIQGPVLAGSIVQASAGKWSDEADYFPSPGNPIVTTQWQIATLPDGSDGVDIPGATFLYYTSSAADLGKYLRLVVNVSDTGIGTPAVHKLSASTPWTRILAPVTYDTWKSNVFGTQAGVPAISDPDKDPDGDGRNNVGEYIGLTNPLAVDSPASSQLGIHEVATFQRVERYLTVGCRVRADASDFMVQGQASTNLLDWMGPLEELQRVRNDDGTDTITFRDNYPNADQLLRARFLRVRFFMFR